MTTTSSPHQGAVADLDEITRALAILFPGTRLGELRVLGAPRVRTVSGYYTDRARMAQAAERWSGKAKGVYTTLNEVQPALLARAANRMVEAPEQTTSDADIVRRRWLYLDLDPVRPTGISSSDAEHAAAVRRGEEVARWLDGRGWPAPIRIDSGNGVALLYSIDLPNDAPALNLVAQCLDAVAFHVGDAIIALDPSVKNAARLIRVPGTLNCKGDDTPERPHRLARLRHVPDLLEVVSADLLQDLAALAPRRPEPEARFNRQQGPDLDLDSWIVTHGLLVARTGPWQDGWKWVLAACPWNPAHTDLSAYIVRLRSGAIAAGCHHAGCQGKGWADLRALFDKDREAFTSHPSDDADAADQHNVNPIADIPALPDWAALTPEAEDAARSVRGLWLDPFLLAAGRLSARTPIAFLEACGLFALMLAIARRCYVQLALKRFFPAAYFLCIGRSTLRAKTTGLEVLRALLRDAGLDDLLLPSTFTPQALTADLSLWVHPSVRDGSDRDRDRWLDRHRHAAARGVIRDEASGLFEDCSKDYNAGLLPLILKLDGAPDTVDPDLTISRGVMEIENACLSIIGGTTPAALREHVSRPYHWHNGLFGRWALIAPDSAPRWAFWRTGEGFPPMVLQGLRRLYDAFPRPYIEFDYAAQDDGEDGNGGSSNRRKPSVPKIVGATQYGYSAIPARMTPAAEAAYRTYDRALYELAARPEHPERMDPTYGRLPSLAVRLALTLATSAWAMAGRSEPPTLDLGHWAAAQQITERWRADGHRILAAALDADAQEAGQSDVETLIDLLGRRGRQKRGEVLRALNWSATRLSLAVSGSGGRVVEMQEPTGGRPAVWLMLAGHANTGASPKAADGDLGGTSAEPEFEEGEL
jgi:hypothetical protein